MDINEKSKRAKGTIVLKVADKGRKPKFAFKGVGPSLEERSISSAIERWTEVVRLSEGSGAHGLDAKTVQVIPAPSPKKKPSPL